MSDNKNQSAEVGEMEIELPPALAQFLKILEKEQGQLLKNKAFGNPDQLRKFIATTLYERLVQLVQMFGTTMYDIHTLSASNATQIVAQRKWAAKHLRALGAEVNDGEAFAGLGVVDINNVGQALYALGSYLSTKYPEDKEAEKHFNGLTIAFNELLAALMGNQSVPDDDEEEEEEEEEEEGDDEEASDGLDADLGDDGTAEADDEPAGDA